MQPGGDLEVWRMRSTKEVERHEVAMKAKQRSTNVAFGDAGKRR